MLGLLAYCPLPILAPQVLSLYIYGGSHKNYVVPSFPKKMQLMYIRNASFHKDPSQSNLIQYSSLWWVNRCRCWPVLSLLVKSHQSRGGVPASPVFHIFEHRGEMLDARLRALEGQLLLEGGHLFSATTFFPPTNV